MRVVRDQFRSDFAMNWNKQDVDLVICPVFIGPAFAHDSALDSKSPWYFHMAHSRD